MGDDDEEEGKTAMPVEDKNKKSKPELHGMIYLNITQKKLHPVTLIPHKNMAPER